jgi:hypothetical protein
VQAYVEKLRASETYELKQDYKAGWTEDHAILSQRPIASQPAKRPGAPANEPGDAFSDSPRCVRKGLGRRPAQGQL